MERYIKLLESTKLFEGIGGEDILRLLKCMDSRRSTYEKNQYLYINGENFTKAGLILKGSVYIIKDDFWGNRTILAEIGEGELFGETFSCLGGGYVGVSVVATEKTDILLMDMQRLLNRCEGLCGFHSQAIQNFIRIIAYKNVYLTRKMEHICQRTTRQKILSYLSEECQKREAKTFEIPFNRQELADFLSVDRSAMSSELSKLKKEGILDFKKNKFTLIN